MSTNQVEAPDIRFSSSQFCEPTPPPREFRCMKSSMFYRTPIRTRSHVFVPGEYQPKQLESNLEASGPLDTRDFHNQFPNKRLVRVDSPYIIFDSEEARWMTKVSNSCYLLFFSYTVINAN
ncbi:unnamed protein product [Schistosoma mattheei]|uniref:Uncharacterized protein n=1 Tax=Schistosoma mattheei TaxID=31246 RepID=A0A183P1I2_9TREM|nr:unnamed protein product [Schistosoma mattheei]